MRCIASFLTIFLLSYAINGKAENKTKIFKSKKYGFEFSYPENWEVESAIGGLEPDEEVPIDEESALLILDRQNYISNKCSRNCQVYLYTHRAVPTSIGYQEKLAYIEAHYMRPKGKKVQVVEGELNGNKFVFVVEILKNLNYQIATQAFFYCPQSYTIISFTNLLDLSQKNNKSFQSIDSMLLNLETLFYPEQIPIIKSIKCPPKNFVYKKEEKIKPKKK